MQPESRTEQRIAVGAVARRSLSEKDHEAVGAMRKEVAPFKGRMSEPSARPPWCEVMEHTHDARGVTYEKVAETNEVLLDDTRRHAVKARAAGVEAEAHVWERMTHVFSSIIATLEAAEKASSLMAAFLDEKLGTRRVAAGSPNVRGRA